MLKLMRFAVCLLAVVMLCGPVECALHIGEPDGNKQRDMSWTDATMEEVIKGLADLGVRMIAALPDAGDAGALQSRKQFKALPEHSIADLASSWERDLEYMGTVNILLPYKLHSLQWGRQAVSSYLIASLSPEQLAEIKTSGGVPFDTLTAQQKNYVRYLAMADRGPRFPEPELSMRLDESKVILALHANLAWSYEIKDVNGIVDRYESEFGCARTAAAKLWRQWAPGQLEAHKLIEKAGMTPGPDAPGSADVVELAGVYRLQDLIKQIMTESRASVTCDPSIKDMRIAAYCSLTSAGLARALASATGMEWMYDGRTWKLAKGAIGEILAQYGTGKYDEYQAAIDKFKPERKKIAQSGICTIVADEVWNTPEMAADMVDQRPLYWDSLTPGQQEYLRETVEDYLKYNSKYLNGYDLAGNLPYLKMWWEPSLSIYIATDDSILYSEWLLYR